MNITYNRNSYPVLETRVMSTGTYGRINISTSDRAAYIWQPLPPVQGCAEPPPMHIYPMPAMYPQAVWLGICNGILEQAKRELESRIADQRVISIAIADGQIPDEVCDAA